MFGEIEGYDKVIHESENIPCIEEITQNVETKGLKID